MIYYKKSQIFEQLLGSQAVTFDFLKINKNLFYHVLILYPCKKESYNDKIWNI